MTTVYNDEKFVLDQGTIDKFTQFLKLTIKKDATDRANPATYKYLFTLVKKLDAEAMKKLMDGIKDNLELGGDDVFEYDIQPGLEAKGYILSVTVGPRRCPVTFTLSSPV